jgi:hypothetical protein
MTSGDDDERGSSNLRGWLSDVYFHALAQGQADKLAIRLGAKATVTDPAFGRADGLEAIGVLLEKQAAWLGAHKAEFRHARFTSGADRDVTEGMVRYDASGPGAAKGKRSELPVAIVAERRRAREVDVRLYFPAEVLGEGHEQALPAAVPGDGAIAPEARALLLALNSADESALRVELEKTATYVDPAGQTHQGDDIHTQLLAPNRSGVVFHPVGSADDGRVAAVEGNWRSGGGDGVTETFVGPGLWVFERGDGGLVSRVRLYGSRG